LKKKFGKTNQIKEACQNISPKPQSLLSQIISIGIWKVYYRNVFLGYFDEKHLRNKEQSTRLETNLM